MSVPAVARAGYADLQVAFANCSANKQGSDEEDRANELAIDTCLGSRRRLSGRPNSERPRSTIRRVGGYRLRSVEDRRPAGLKCRATQETSGGTGNIAGAGAGGTFRRWSAFGALAGAKFYYHVSEATSLRAQIRESASLEDGVKNMSPQGKGAKDFSTMTHRAGADLVTFTSAAGEPCVGIRRYGPSAQTGYKWILNATRCAPKGKPASAAEIDKFISEADYRS